MFFCRKAKEHFLYEEVVRYTAVRIMTLDEIETALCRLVARYLRCAPLDVARDLPFEKMVLNSLARIDLLCDVEDTFALEIPEAPGSLLRANTVSKFAVKIQSWMTSA